MRSFYVGAVLCASALACSDDMTMPEPVELSVTLAPDTFAVAVGTTVTVEVRVDGDEPDELSTVACTTDSSAIDVMESEGSCLVTGAEPGDAVLTVNVERGEESGSAEAVIVVAQEL